VQTQHDRATDSRYRDDVHRAVFLIAHFGNLRIAAQCADDLGDGIAVPDDQYAPAAVLVQCPICGALGILGRYNRLADAQTRGQWRRREPVAQCRRHENRVQMTDGFGIAEHLREQCRPRNARGAERRIGEILLKFLLRMADHDDRRRAGRAPDPGEKDCKTQGHECCDRRQPNRRQKWSPLEADVVFFHAIMILPMNSLTLPGLTVLILAAGFSSRLGHPKALAGVRSVSLMRRTLMLAARLAPAKILVVIPHRATRYRLEARGLTVTFIANLRREEGLSSSVRRGLARSRFSSALLLLPVDLASLQPRDLNRLTSRWQASRRRVVARRIGGDGGMQRGGVPLILPHWLYPRALEVTGDVGLRELVSAVSAEQRVLVDLPAAARDVDTADDLRAARRHPRARLNP
jgi:molybdenum cofactor cytidylyltransferase